MVRRWFLISVCEGSNPSALMFFNKLYFFIPTSNNFFYYFLVVSVLTLVIFCLPFLLAPNAFFVERLSAYECGFDPFVSSKEVFESHFIVVAILFIVFDLEIIFLLPWVISGGFTEVVCF